ncbi:Trifunctional nucleotide phosphoesterase protein YfkN [Fundidesulfovibrio magnetotacticus]|uniref:Trifunctional nucleotide phosphoesterase protein YfkN n=1 Tax=Fundidesulfovibrio magnetotacticus TaxID=2730080 RepID=A0A6V8LTZ2_9BACT|nr:bifunctional metallophosphatase/5'-nucleotidase [Fundidesulfovibrio magnetotacticus]GFK95194.1 Trifunctional nucleotide phosphoesterase protein YfkN [Fundidesulfovibrio magnetotacticus]
MHSVFPSAPPRRRGRFTGPASLALLLAVLLAALCPLAGQAAEKARHGAQPAAQTAAKPSAQPLRLTILHTNDVHARIQEFNRFGQTCTPEESSKGECFGGFPRLAAAVAARRAKGGNVLLLDAGDQFQGTLFYTVLKGRPSRDAMNALRYNAMTLGNHEFDDGPEVLVETFLNGLSFPVLAANVDASGFEPLKERIAPWSVISVGGRKVGLVGLAYEDTASISAPGPDVAFGDARQALERGVKAVTAQGADIVVALTHVGYGRDKELAASVDGVDVIVGGHTHTLLSSTDPKAAGPYPTVVPSPSGRPVLVVQAEAWGKYLGELTVDFDASGVPSAWSGQPLLLDASMAQDPALLAKARGWQEELAPFLNQPVGKAAEALPFDCRFGECVLGSVLADAVRMAGKAQGAQAAFVNGGAIRTGLRAGDVSQGDLLAVYPFADTVATFQLSGKDLLAVLEHGVGAASDPSAKGTGRFLQVSGIHYSFDGRRPEGQRIVTASIQGADGGFTPVNPEALYTLATTSYLLKGGDGNAVLKDGARRVYAFGKSVSDALADYVASHSPLPARPEGRITRLGDALPQ